MKRSMPIGIVVCLTIATATAALAQETAPDFKALVEDKNEALSKDMEGAAEGDLKQFRVLTDEDIGTLEVGDIYKNNTSFFKITAIARKGKTGGEFLVQRTGGRMDPVRFWNRVSGLGPMTIASRETLFDTYMNGGMFMHPISFCLLGTVVIAFSNIWVFRHRRHCPPAFVEQARAALATGDVQGFQALAAKTRGLLAAVCRTMALNPDISTEEDVKVRCESEARRQINALRLPLRALNFFAAVAPLLGLLGTVQGMIMCFDSLGGETASAAKSQMMASGIKVALYTTFYGLTVAIPALFTYFVSNHKLSNIVGESEVVVAEFAHRLALRKRNAGGAGGGEERP
jgi:biopolymer transport protein ExbB